MLKTSIDLFKTTNFSPERVKELQRNDSDLRPIIDYLDGNSLPKLQKKARRLIIISADYLLIDGLLFHSRVAKSKRTQGHRSYQLVLPKVMIKEILKIYHESPLAACAHGGIQHTIDVISEHFYFSKLPSTVSNFVKSCHECQARKMTKAHTKSGIISYPTPTKPFQVWQIDLVGPLPITNKGHTYIFTAVDMFSKFLFTVPLKASDSMTVSSAMFQLITQF